MALWFQCQEAINLKSAYHAWRVLKKSASTDTIHGGLGGGNDSSENYSDVGDCLGRVGGNNRDCLAAQEPSGM